MIKSFTVIMFLFSSLSAMAQTESRDVPTNQLTAVYQISPSADGQVMELFVEFDQVRVVNGVIQQDITTQSHDDVVVFKVGQTSVTYDPGDTGHNVLPVVEGGHYDVVFTRFNGEVFKSAVDMPANTVFESPLPGTVFNKADEVQITWNQVNAPIRMGYFDYTCAGGAPAGEIAVNEEFTVLTLPAGFMAACQGPVPFRLDMINATFGTGYGTLIGSVMASLNFSYEGAAPWLPAKATSRQEQMRKFRAQYKSHNRMIVH